MFDVHFLLKSLKDALFSQNARNQASHVQDHKSDIRDRKSIPWATFYADIVFQKIFELKVGFLDSGFLCFFFGFALI